MDKGISNIEIKNSCNDEQNEDFKENYMGVYLMDSITRYIHFYKITRKRNAKYPFVIFSKDRHNKLGTHWGSLWIFT